MLLMKGNRSLNSGQAPLADRADVTQLLGALDDAGITEILAMRPTRVELEEAAAWLEGQGDMVDRAGHALTPRIAVILDIIERDEEDERGAR